MQPFLGLVCLDGIHGVTKATLCQRETPSFPGTNCAEVLNNTLALNLFLLFADKLDIAIVWIDSSAQVKDISAFPICQSNSEDWHVIDPFGPLYETFAIFHEMDELGSYAFPGILNRFLVYLGTLRLIKGYVL
jgi:hypothetical protein